MAKPFSFESFRRSVIPRLVALCSAAVLIDGCDDPNVVIPVAADDAGVADVSSTDEALIVTAAQTGRVSMSADTTVRTYLANTPGGSSRDLLVGRSLLDWTRSMVRVDTQAMKNMLGTEGQFLSAKLVLTITASIDGSLNGTEVGAHRVTKAWTEAGATWNCAIDGAPTNLWNDCTTANRWTMGGAAGTGPYVSAPTGTGKVTTGLSGTLELDVSSDVRAFLNGTAPNNGWLLRVQNDPIASIIYMSSREGASPPQLLLTFVGPCNAATGKCGTEVQWEAPGGEELPVLEDPLTSAQTAAAADGFNWANTSPVPELTPEGYPTLRYATIYIESQSQLANLDLYEIDHSRLPLFRAERTKWKGKKGVFEYTGDGRGIFVFAILPGKIYNLLRQYAIEHPDEQPYRAIILRVPPAEMATYPDGSLRYGALAEQGYLYRGIGAEQNASVSGKSQPLFGVVRKLLVEPIVGAGKAVVDGVRQGLAGAGRFIKGASALNLTFYANVADPAFKSKALIRRGWGANRGKPVPVRGAEVRVSQGLVGGQLAREWTDRNGFTRILVTRNSDADICVSMDNSDAILTTFMFPMETCQFDIPAGDVNGEVTQRLHISSRYMQGFVQALDSADFLRDVGHHSPHRVRLLTGRIAKWLTGVQKNGGGAFAPCSDFPNWKFDTLYAVMNIAMSHVALAPPVSDADGDLVLYKERLAAIGGLGADFVSPDIVISTSALRSRGVMTHEYGHFAMCSLLFDEGADVFADAYTEVITDALLSDGKPADEARVVAEAWADFFSAQVAGGVNYFAPYYGPRPTEPSTSLHMTYCDPNERQCMDDNIGGRTKYDPTARPFAQRTIGLDAFHAAIGQVATTLHDVFDGNPNAGQANVPGNGAAWFNDKPIDGDRTETTPYPFNNLGHQGDESVTLPMDLPDLIHRWATVDFNSKHRLKKKSIDVALSQYMTAHGISDTRICELFALHSSSNTCPSILPITQNFEPGPVLLTGHLYATIAGTEADPSKEDPRGRNAHWEWTADSPYAERFEYTVTDGSSVLATGFPPYARDMPIVVNHLNAAFNRELEISVRVVNGARSSKPVAHVLATPAEPVTTISAVREPAQTRVCWSETAATSYEVEYRPTGQEWVSAAIVDDTSAATSCLPLRGLPPVATEARVTARNKHGVATDASPIVVFTPLAPKEIFVSIARGNNTTATGTRTLPFATIDAALAFLAAQRAVTTAIPVCDRAGVCTTQNVRSTAHDYAALRITAGSYSANAFAISGSAFTTVLTGGLAEGTWAASAGAVSSVRVTLRSGPVLGCNGAATGTAWLSGVAVKDGALTLEGLAVSAVPVPVAGESRTCQTVVGARLASGLTIRGSVVSFVGNAGVGACQIGVAVDGSAGSPSDAASLTDSTVIGASLTSSQNLSGSFIGVCSGGMASVRVERSDITATDAPQASSATGAGSLTGALITGAQALSVSRSFISAVDNRPEWRNGAAQLALGGTAKYIRIDNSVLRTATGGTANAALVLTPSAGGDVRIAHVSAITGAAWGQAVTGPSDQKGAAVMQLGGVTKRIVIVNSLFAYAAGSHIDKTGIDRSAVTGNPASALIAGNIFAVYDLTFDGSIALASPVRCKQGPGAYADSWTLNEPTFHGCAGTLGDPRSYKVENNRWVYERPCSTYPVTAGTGAVTEGTCRAALAGAGAWHGIAMTEHFLDGRPMPLGDARVACSGVKLPPEFTRGGSTFASKDFFGVTRLQNRAGVDDDCNDKIDEPSEKPSMLNSVGAYDAVCSCATRSIYVE